MAGIPYAPRSVYQPDNTIIGLIQQAGRDAAQGQRAGGAIWGNTVNGLGQIAAGTIQDIAAGKAHAAEVARKEALEAPIRQQQQRLGEMSLQKGERERAAAETEAMRAQKLAEMFSGDAPPSPNAIIGLFSDDPERGFNIVKGLTAIQPDSEKKIERYRDQATLLRDAVAGVGSTPEPLKPQAWTMARNSLISRGLISEDMVPADYSPEAFEMVANFGREAKPETPRVVGRSLVDNSGKVIYRDPESRPAGSDNKMWVMRAGPDGKMKTVFVPESQVQPGDQPANTRTGEGRPSLGGEKSALGFFNRAKQADEELSGLTKQISDMGLGDQAWMATMPNFLQTQEGQAYQQAQRAFTEARLRKDSGAAIPETEFANDRKTYFVQPGDSKETIAQKERGRAAVLASLAFQSGRALNEFYGDEAEPLLEGYKARQASKAAAAPGQSSGGGVSVSLPNGKAKVFPNQAAADAFKKAAGIK